MTHFRFLQNLVSAESLGIGPIRQMACWAELVEAYQAMVH
jgi:hypothetical protein